MARPLKQGLDYFPHDTDAHADDKMQALISLHGMAGCGMYWTLVEKIYRTEDGYLDMTTNWKREVIAGNMRMPVEMFDKILDSMLDIGLFQKSIYELDRKLTSDGLVKRREYLLSHRMAMREKRASSRLSVMTPEQEKGLAGKLAGKYPETAMYRAKQSLNSKEND